MELNTTMNSSLPTPPLHYSFNLTCMFLSSFIFFTSQRNTWTAYPSRRSPFSRLLRRFRAHILHHVQDQKTTLPNLHPSSMNLGSLCLSGLHKSPLIILHTSFSFVTAFLATWRVARILSLNFTSLSSSLLPLYGVISQGSKGSLCLLLCTRSTPFLWIKTHRACLASRPFYIGRRSSSFVEPWHHSSFPAIQL